MPELRFASAVVTTYSPVAGAAITLSDESATTKTLVRSDRPQFDLTFGHSRTIGDALVAATRPDEWLILDLTSKGSDPSEVRSHIDEGGFTSVIPSTHGRSLFRVTGEPAASLLEKVCNLDWSDAMTPDGAVVSASVALVTCDIVRNDLAGVPSYLLVSDRSFGQYLFDALVDAGTELGVTVA